MFSIFLKGVSSLFLCFSFQIYFIASIGIGVLLLMLLQWSVLHGDVGRATNLGERA